MAANRHPRLTPELHRQIVAAIRAGGYPHVAAQAFGVGAAAWDEWLRRGMAPAARPLYRWFARDVQQAHAQARLRAEINVHGEAPRLWLQHGPGRDRADSPGWAGAVQPAAVTTTQINPLLQPELLDLVRTVRDLFADAPEAQQKVGRWAVEHGVRIAG